MSAFTLSGTVRVVNPKSSSEINVHQLMREIREELAQQACQSGAPSLSESSTRFEQSDLNEIAASLRRIASEIRPPTHVRLSLAELVSSATGQHIRADKDGAFQWRDFLQYEGEAFVRVAYQALLRREVDEDGLTCYLTMLRNGASKVEILGRICESTEARNLETRVLGLAFPYALETLRRWPVIGRIVGIVVAIWNLPENERQIRRVTVELVQRISQGEHNLARTIQNTQEALVTLQGAQNSMSDITRMLASRAHLEAIQRALLRVVVAIGALKVSNGPIRSVEKPEIAR